MTPLDCYAFFLQEATDESSGSPNKKVDIICDGQNLAITTSLERALRRVRLATDTRILWADGICIKQHDVQERASQVQVMALIYLRATRVLAWIGHGDGAETASLLIKKYRKVFEDALEEKEDLNLLELMDAQDQADLEFVVQMFGEPLDAPMIRADDTMSLSYILTQLTFLLCLESKSLRPLSAVHHDKLCSSKDFPSWVPALHKASLVGPFGVNEKLYYAADSAIEDVEMFRSSPDGVLIVRGLVFDTLNSFSLPSFPDSTGSTEQERMQAFREAFALSQFQVKVAYETGKRLEAFGFTMTAGLFETSAAEDRIEEYRANFCAYLIKFYEMQRNTRRKHALGLDTKLVADVKEEAMNGKEYILTRDANATWSGRKFFCTTRGFFGLGPKVLRKNDLCCVLFGARVPHILRKMGDHYLLVGKCYLHEIMHGEAIDMWRNGRLQLQEFELH